MAGQTPIWKKEIRLRSKPPKAAVETSADNHKQGNASIWKKDLTLRSGKSKGKQPAEVAATSEIVAAEEQPAEVAATSEIVAAEEQRAEVAATSEIVAAPGHGSIWKRELRIRRSVPKSRASSEIDSILAPAAEVEEIAPVGASGEADDSVAEPTRSPRRSSRRRQCSRPRTRCTRVTNRPNRRKDAAQLVCTSAKLVEPATTSAWTSRRSKRPSTCMASLETAGFEGLSEESDSLADELQEHTPVLYGASAELNPFTAPAEEDAPLEEFRGAPPEWGSTGAADAYRYPDANVAESPADAVDWAPDAFEPQGLRSEDDREGPTSFALGVDEPLQAESEKETESRFSDAESDLEHSDLGTPAELWAKPWTPALSDAGDSDQETPGSVAEGLRMEEVDAHVAPYLPSYERSVTDEPEEAPATADEGDFLSTFAEPELPFARTDAALESSSGDSVASSYRELDLVSESAAFPSSLDQVTPGDERDEQIILPEADSSDWLTALGDEEGHRASGLAAIDVEPDPRIFRGSGGGLCQPRRSGAVFHPRCLE